MKRFSIADIRLQIWALAMFSVALALGVLSIPIAAEPASGARIGILGGGSASLARHVLDAFRERMRELGYVEGQNLTIEVRYAEGRFERFPDLAAELVRLKVDVIVAVVTPAALAARNATRTTPIITVAVTDPVASGLVASFARPGGNITGLTIVAGPEIIGKYLELLKEALPAVTRLAVLWNPTHPAHPSMLREAESPARSLGVQLQPVGVRGPNEFDDAFAAMSRERAGGVVVPTDPMYFQHRTRLAELARKYRLPAIYGLREHVDAGGLISYGADLSDLFKRAATYVDRVLKGTVPADLPVERPTKFDLVINLKTAKALGLTIPQSLLMRADEVIE